MDVALAAYDSKNEYLCYYAAMLFTSNISIYAFTKWKLHVAFDELLKNKSETMYYTSTFLTFWLFKFAYNDKL